MVLPTSFETDRGNYAALADNLKDWLSPEQQLAYCQRVPSMAKYLGIQGLDHPHLFITVLLSREKPVGVLYDSVLTLTPRVADLMGGLAVIELVPHPHVHILIDRPERFKKSNLIRAIQRALKLERPELIDVQSGRSVSDYNNRKNYLEGQKSNHAKAERQEQDKLLRDTAGIPHLITL